MKKFLSNKYIRWNLIWTAILFLIVGGAYLWAYNSGDKLDVAFNVIGVAFISVPFGAVFCTIFLFSNPYYPNGELRGE
jgi:hypothetical protein